LPASASFARPAALVDVLDEGAKDQRAIASEENQVLHFSRQGGEGLPVAFSRLCVE
jgi:hypothetical protein